MTENAIIYFGLAKKLSSNYLYFFKHQHNTQYTILLSNILLLLLLALHSHWLQTLHQPRGQALLHGSPLHHMHTPLALGSVRCYLRGRLLQLASELALHLALLEEHDVRCACADIFRLFPRDRRIVKAIPMLVLFVLCKSCVVPTF